jgi:hypothetical protein
MTEAGAFLITQRDACNVDSAHFVITMVHTPNEGENT